MQIKQRLCKERLGSGNPEESLIFEDPPPPLRDASEWSRPALVPRALLRREPPPQTPPQTPLTLGLFFKNKVVRTVFPRQQIVTALAAVCVQILLSQTPLSSGKTT